MDEEYQTRYGGSFHIRIEPSYLSEQSTHNLRMARGERRDVLPLCCHLFCCLRKGHFEYNITLYIFTIYHHLLYFLCCLPFYVLNSLNKPYFTSVLLIIQQCPKLSMRLNLLFVNGSKSVFLIIMEKPTTQLLSRFVSTPSLPFLTI